MSLDEPEKTIQLLFPPEVITEEMMSPPCLADLHPAEQACITKVGRKRRLDFAAGRVCARRAMAQLGVDGFPLLVGEKGQPVWPPGIVGSISHCEGYCGAAVAREREVRSIGLDMERLQELDDEFARLVCTRQELDWIQALPSDQRRVGAVLLFSAKECLYKCQFPLTGQWLDFQDVRVSVRMDDDRFEVTSATTRQSDDMIRLTGKYLVRGGCVFTGMIA